MADDVSIRSAPLIYLDTSALKRTSDPPGPPAGRVEEEQHALAQVSRAFTSGQARLLISFWLVRENSADPDSLRIAAANRILDAAWACVFDTRPLRTLAAHLVQLGVSLEDAPHLAAAELGGADYLVTSDDRLIRRAARPAVARLLTVAIADPLEIRLEIQHRGVI